MTLNQHKIKNYVIIASLKSETMGKLINRIPGSRLLISSLPGLPMSTSVLEALLGKLDIKRHSPSILYLSHTPSVDLNGPVCLRSLARTFLAHTHTQVPCA